MLHRLHAAQFYEDFATILDILLDDVLGSRPQGGRVPGIFRLGALVVRVEDVEDASVHDDVEGAVRLREYSAWCLIPHE